MRHCLRSRSPDSACGVPTSGRMIVSPCELRRWAQTQGATKLTCSFAALFLLSGHAFAELKTAAMFSCRAVVA